MIGSPPSNDYQIMTDEFDLWLRAMFAQAKAESQPGAAAPPRRYMTQFSNSSLLIANCTSNDHPVRVSPAVFPDCNIYALTEHGQEYVTAPVYRDPAVIPWSGYSAPAVNRTDGHQYDVRRRYRARYSVASWWIESEADARALFLRLDRAVRSIQSGTGDAVYAAILCSEISARALTRDPHGVALDFPTVMIASPILDGSRKFCDSLLIHQ